MWPDDAEPSGLIPGGKLAPVEVDPTLITVRNGGIACVSGSPNNPVRVLALEGSVVTVAGVGTVHARNGSKVCAGSRVVVFAQKGAEVI